ncbi:glycoside hydrolase family 15 protein (plasmid) [Haloferacaceae archaeon DSL9]
MSPRTSTDAGDPYLPISEYALIGNDNRCALVGSHGSIDWCCFPHVASPSVFAAILDDDIGGRFAIQPVGAYESSQAYIERTNVATTRFETNSGAATVTDFMPIREANSSDEAFQRALYRKIDDVRGSIDLQVVFEPRFDYARASTTIERTERGDFVAAGGDDETDLDDLHLHTGADLTVEDGRAAATLSLDADDSYWFGLQYDQPNRLSVDERGTVLDETVEFWRTWLGGCEESAIDLFEFNDEWRDVLTRSALALKLCIHEDAGSICAAPTTSLPEEIGGDLNWDYRYNWIRDAKFTIRALYNVGQTSEAREYFEWFRDLGHEDPEDIQPLYGLYGEMDLTEETLDHLSGYRDSTPVRIGNEAAAQKQLDIYGTIVQGIYETVRYGEGLADDDWRSIVTLAEHVCDRWDEEDAGIWEFRDLTEHYVHSKLLCWVALDRAIHLAAEHDRDAPLDRWEREREAIREAIESRGYNEDVGAFVQYFGADAEFDATALLLPLYDFLPPEDERIQNTIDTVIEELTTEDGLVYRFSGSEARPQEPGGFVLCSFWLVDALVVSGRIEEAEERFESLLDRVSPVGLLSEMIRTEDGRFLGNYPQAFSHIGLINSAIYLAGASDDSGRFSPERLSEGATSPLFRRHGTEQP